MTDKTESKVRQWVTKRNGEDLTPTDVVELVLAVDDDGTERHEESMEQFAAIDGRLVDHGRRIDELEHAALTAVSLLRRGDDSGEDHTGERREGMARKTWFMWMVGTWFGKLLLIMAGGLGMLLISYLGDTLSGK